MGVVDRGELWRSSIILNLTLVSHMSVEAKLPIIIQHKKEVEANEKEFRSIRSRRN